MVCTSKKHVSRDLLWFMKLFHRIGHCSISWNLSATFPDYEPITARLFLKVSLPVIPANVYTQLRKGSSSVSLSLSHWYPGSGVVLECIDSWSLQPYYFKSFSSSLGPHLEVLLTKHGEPHIFFFVESIFLSSNFVLLAVHLNVALQVQWQSDTMWQYFHPPQ